MNHYALTDSILVFNRTILLLTFLTASRSGA